MTLYADSAGFPPKTTTPRAWMKAGAATVAAATLAAQSAARASGAAQRWASP